MGVFNNQNTFYNSTWHQYKAPVMRQQLQPIQLNAPKLEFPSYAKQWKQFRNNPFGINSSLLPAQDNTYEPFPINPFSYTNYDPYAVGYDDIYNNVGPIKSTANKGNINTLKGVFGGISATADAIGQGRTTGDNDANHYIGMVSKLGSNLPGTAGLVFSGINAASSIVNALVGSKLNDKNIKAMEAAIQNRSRYQFGDNSTTDALIAGSQSNVDLAAPGADFYGKDGLLQDWLGYGVGKAHGKAWSNKGLISNANAQAHNTEALAYKDFQNKMIRRGLLAEPYALGGAINRFDNGGGINTPFTHGGLFSNGLIQINNGGSHETNPNQGVQFGVDEMGIPNLVEEGETIYSAGAYGGPDSYSFSDRIKFPIDEYGNMFSLGGRTKTKKGKKNKSYTFAEISKLLSKESEERPNDDKSLRTFAENLGKLAMIQEEVKAKDMLNQMNPLDVMMALQQSPMADQMGAMQGMGEQLPMEGEQQPMMAACGGKLHSFGGNLFRYGGRSRRRRSTRRSRPRVNVKVENGIIQSIPIYEGNFNSAFNAARSNGNATFEWNGRAYNTRLRGESLDDYNNYLNNFAKPAPTSTTSEDVAQVDYSTNPVMLRAFGGNLFANGGNLFANGGSAGGNHTFIDGKKINSLPESIILHDDLFSKAISEYIADNKKAYDQAVKDKDFEKAKNIMSYVYSYINTINEYYARTYNTPDGTPNMTNLAILQNAFDQAGLNKYVNDFLSNSKRVFRGKSQYSSDNPLDMKNGVITQNRYITLSEKDIEALYQMGLAAGNFWDVYETEGLTLGDNPYDVVKNLQGVKLRDPIASFLVQNPKYTEGGQEPQYLNPYDVFKDSAPEGTTDLSKWWDDLSFEDKISIIQKGGYKAVGDAIQLSPIDFQYIVGLENGSSGDNSGVTDASVQSTTSSSSNDKGQNEYYIPKPRNDWESTAAMLTALRDDILAQLSSSKDFTPGADAAYSYLSRVGNIPMVRSTPTGTRMAYRPTDLNFGLNADRNDMFGLIRTSNNLNKGNATANDIAIMNAGREQMAKTRQQAVEDDLKKLQFVLSNNNQVDQFNAQNSLTAQTTNAQNLARARETQATVAAQLASTLGQGYKNWIDYKNAQSSGLAQMLYDQGYNKQVLNLRDAAFLLNNQQKDALKTAGIPYEVVQDILNTYKG